MEIQKVNLNYRSAVRRVQPVEKVSASSMQMEYLDVMIRQKAKQNMQRYVAGEMDAKRHIVR